MPIIENRFFEAAIAFFDRNRTKSNKFIELTRTGLDGDEKFLLNKDHITSVEPLQNSRFPSKVYTNGNSFLVNETYQQIKAML